MNKLLELQQLAEHEDIALDYFKLEKREALSLMAEDGLCYIAVDPLKLKGLQDEKLKLSHELGHCCTGSFYNRWATCDVRRKHENRADKWSIERLVPLSEFDVAIANGYSDLWALAEFFGVTVEFMRKAACWYIHGNLDVEQYMDF